MSDQKINMQRKRCPFCGSDDLDVRYGKEGVEPINNNVLWPVSVICDHCGARGPEAYIRKTGMSIDDAARLAGGWNERDGDDAENDAENDAKLISVLVSNGEAFKFEGRYMREREKSNWHYYERVDGRIYHFRKEHIVSVIEDEAP